MGDIKRSVVILRQSGLDINSKFSALDKYARLIERSLYI